MFAGDARQPGAAQAERSPCRGAVHVGGIWGRSKSSGGSPQAVDHLLLPLAGKRARLEGCGGSAPTQRAFLGGCDGTPRSPLQEPRDTGGSYGGIQGAGGSRGHEKELGGARRVVGRKIKGQRTPAPAVRAARGGAFQVLSLPRRQDVARAAGTPGEGARNSPRGPARLPLPPQNRARPLADGAEVSAL